MFKYINLIKFKQRQQQCLISNSSRLIIYKHEQLYINSYYYPQNIKIIFFKVQIQQNFVNQFQFQQNFNNKVATMYSINQKKCWNRMNPIAFTYLQDNQLSANNLTKIQTPLNCRQTDSKSLDYLKYKRSLDQNPQRKLQKLQTINMTINPEQIKLQPKMIVQKFNKQVQYDLETDSRFYKKYASQNQSLDAYTNHKVKREQLEAKKNMQSKLKNKNIQIDPQKLIEYAERQYFKILHRPQKLRLPSLDNQLISPKKGDFISEYHRSFKSQKKKQQQEKLIQHDFSYVSIRKQLRKINPTYTSSLKNPLSDLNFQIKLIPHD